MLYERSNASFDLAGFVFDTNHRKAKEIPELIKMVREGMQTSTDTVTAIIFLIAFGIGMLVTGFNFTTGTSISREGKVFIS